MVTGTKARSDDEMADALARILDKEDAQASTGDGPADLEGDDWRSSGPPLDATSTHDPRFPIVG